jgi:predicted nucleic acid-binding protein
MIAVDANVILEILEERRLYDAAVMALERFGGTDVDLAVSTLTVSHVFYLAERHKLPMNRAEAVISKYKIFDVLKEDVRWALRYYKGKDFEDALQVAAALREKCSAFLTLDAGLAKKYAKYLNIELVGG